MSPMIPQRYGKRWGGKWPDPHIYNGAHVLDVPLIPFISVKALSRIFWTRFGLASFTKRSKLFNRAIKRFLFDGDHMVVLPKDNTATLRRIEMDIDFDDGGERTVVPSDAVKEMIRRSSDIFIMDFCLCRKSSKCKDYPVERGCVFLGKGVHRIPEEFGRLATAEEAIGYIDECRALGLVHIMGRNKLDSIWLNTGHKRDLMTICNCCPCCCLWNVVRDISDDIGSMFRRMEGVRIRTHVDRCTGCGECESICFTDAISIVEDRCEIDEMMCRGCGRCVEICSHEAISIDFDERSMRDEIERVSSLVDL